MHAQETYVIGKTTYQRHTSGLYFPDTTPEPVKTALRYLVGTETRVRIFLGNVETGKTWSEEHDCVGRISRSMGPCKVPLLIHSRRSMGGSAIMCDSVLGIMSKGRGSVTWHYKAANFDNGVWTAKAIRKIHDGRHYTGAVYRDGKIYANCVTFERAQRLAAFMRGDSLAK